MAMTAFSDNEDNHTWVTNPYPDLQDLLCDDDNNMSVADSYPDLEQIFSGDGDEPEAEQMSADWEEPLEFCRNPSRFPMMANKEAKGETNPTATVDTGDAYTTTYDAGMLTKNGLESYLIDMELFDSGAS